MELLQRRRAERAKAVERAKADGSHKRAIAAMVAVAVVAAGAILFRIFSTEAEATASPHGQTKTTSASSEPPQVLPERTSSVTTTPLVTLFEATSTTRQPIMVALGARAAALSVALVASAGDLAGVAARDQDPEQRAIQAREAQRLRDAVAELPEPQRALVTRHYFDDERFEQIAEALGISKSWASRLHAQAMATLAGQLGAPPPTLGREEPGQAPARE
jgi:RNA polymerase sigma factor (sigma-70 family)